MQIVSLNEAKIENITKIIQSGGLVVFPCETVYGIGCDCQNSKAVAKLNTYKQRPMGKPYAIMAANRDMAAEYVHLNKTADELYAKFLPGPLTVVSTGKHKVAKGVESETGTLGVRIPNYNWLIKLITALGKPIVATSANASYQKRPYNISDFLNRISKRQTNLISLIVDAGELPHNEPSTVIDTTLDDLVVLRQGDIMLGTNCEVLSRSEENTRNIGKELWQKYEKHTGSRAIVFALEGPMGAGKTQFTKGLAKAMGVEEDIVSPTYGLEIRYKRLKEIEFVHIDAWRMRGAEELDQLGYRKLISDKSVIAIEWADRVADMIRQYNVDAVIVWVKIDYPSASSGQAVKKNERNIRWGVI